MVDTLKVALIQTGLVWEEPEANKALFESLFGSVIPVDLIVLPEMFTTAIPMTVALIQAMSK